MLGAYERGGKQHNSNAPRRQQPWRSSWLLVIHGCQHQPLSAGGGLTPGERILEKAQPGAGPVSCNVGVRRGPGQLPAQEAALRVGHDGQMPSI